MKITVTQKHIDRGVRDSAFNCPLAIAINEQCPCFQAVVGSIYVTLINLSDQRLRPTFELPYEATDFIGEFDSGCFRRRWWHRFAPPRLFNRTFDIALPEPVATPRRVRTSVYDGLHSMDASSIQ